jgi:hypothetical protein
MMDSNAWYLLAPVILAWIFLLPKWEEKKNALREKEHDEAREKERQTLDYFLLERAKFRDRMRKYRSVPDVPSWGDAYIVLYLDGEVWRRLSNLSENDPMAIRLRQSFLNYLETLREHLGWIGFASTEDAVTASNEATDEFKKAEDLILTLLGEECRAVLRKAKNERFSYFNEDGTFRGENTLNLPSVVAP